MIKENECMKLVLKKFPKFKPTWKKYVKCNGKYASGLTIGLAKFADFLVDNFKESPLEKRKDAFDFIEYLMIHGDEDVQNATARG